MADEGRVGNANGVEESRGVGGEVVNRIAASRAIGIAEAALVQGIGVVPLR